MHLVGRRAARGPQPDGGGPTPARRVLMEQWASYLAGEGRSRPFDPPGTPPCGGSRVEGCRPPSTRAAVDVDYVDYH